MIETVCDKDFEQKVIGAVGPVVVDMYGINCISCRKVDAVVERLAPKYDGKCKFYRLNVEESPRTASRYRGFRRFVQTADLRNLIRRGLYRMRSSYLASKNCCRN